MRAIVVSSHPRVDRLAYKESLLTGLAARCSDLMLLYTAVSPMDYIQEMRRRSIRELLERRVLRRSRRTTGSSKSVQPLLTSVAGRLAMRVQAVRELGGPACLTTVSRFRPDVVFNVSSVIVPGEFLDACNRRVVGAHYAELPRVRGSDTIRWSVLLDAPLGVTHIFLSDRIDMGDILDMTRVAVTPGDTVATLREKCQSASSQGHLAVADAVASGNETTRSQKEGDGSTFYRMGSYLRSEVDEILRQHRYSHYVTEGSC